MARLLPPIRPPAHRRRLSDVSTNPSDLITLLIHAMHKFGPWIPLSGEANNAVTQALESVRSGKAPEHMHLLLWDGFDNVDWGSIQNPDDQALSLSVLRLVHLIAVGLAGLPPLDFDGVDEPEPIPFGRVISMILLVEPEMSKLLKIRNGRMGKSIVTTTMHFELEYGVSYRVEVELINAVPPDEMFDLAVPYDQYD